MEFDNAKVKELATRIYDLDQEIYEATGSSLGRVYNGDKERRVNGITENLLSKSRGYIVRKEMVLIGNMGRTIEDKEVRSAVMRKYDELAKETRALPTSWSIGDILDPQLADLNTVNLNLRFNEHDPLIICIGRTAGSCGNEIGLMLSDKLKINYYDVAVMTESLSAKGPGNTARRIVGLKKRKTGPVKFVKDFVKYHGLSEADRLFFDTTKFLVDKGKNKEEFIVMGRFADAILTNYKIPHLSIFVTAPRKARVRRIMTINDNISSRQARKLIDREDRKHNKIYHFYTGRKWGKASNYDLCINSASYGVDGSVDIILKIVDSQKAHKKLEQQIAEGTTDSAKAGIAASTQSNDTVQDKSNNSDSVKAEN